MQQLSDNRIVVALGCIGILRWQAWRYLPRHLPTRGRQDQGASRVRTQQNTRGSFRFNRFFNGRCSKYSLGRSESEPTATRYNTD
jgi:hypothetical protein